MIGQSTLNELPSIIDNIYKEELVDMSKRKVFDVELFRGKILTRINTILARTNGSISDIRGGIWDVIGFTQLELLTDNRYSSTFFKIITDNGFPFRHSMLNKLIDEEWKLFDIVNKVQNINEYLKETLISEPRYYSNINTILISPYLNDFRDECKSKWLDYMNSTNKIECSDLSSNDFESIEIELDSLEDTENDRDFNVIRSGIEELFQIDNSNGFKDADIVFNKINKIFIEGGLLLLKTDYQDIDFKLFDLMSMIEFELSDIYTNHYNVCSDMFGQYEDDSYYKLLNYIINKVESEMIIHILDTFSSTKAIDDTTKIILQKSLLKLYFRIVLEVI